MKFRRAVLGRFRRSPVLGVEVVLAGLPRKEFAGLGHLDSL